MINAGKYNHKITIYRVRITRDAEGYPTRTLLQPPVLIAWAKVKTTRGMTIIRNDSDFEKAYTNFTIRYPKVEILRDCIIEYNDRLYSIEYINNIDEANVEIELQAKEITHS